MKLGFPGSIGPLAESQAILLPTCLLLHLEPRLQLPCLVMVQPVGTCLSALPVKAPGDQAQAGGCALLYGVLGPGRAGGEQVSPRGPCTCDEAMKPESGVSGMSSWACPRAGVSFRLRPRAQEQPPVWTPYSPVLLTNRHQRWAQNKIHRRQGHSAWCMTSVRAAAHWKEVWLPPCSESPCMLGGDPGACLPFTPLRPHQTARRLKPHVCLEDSPDDSPGRGP